MNPNVVMAVVCGWNLNEQKMTAPNSKAILYVEDSEDDVFLMKLAMERAGVTNPLEISRDGQEAIDFLTYVFNNAAPSGPVSLVLLDLKLPKKNGLEVLQWMRSQPAIKTLPVILFSSSNQKADVERAYEYGANAFLVKPADPQALQDMVKSLKHFWLTHNQAPG
jgi:CheY-like chemotaxis protein